MNDLDNMSREELLALRKNVEKALNDYEERQRRKALAAAEQVARSFGLKLTDLVGNGKGRAGGAKGAASGTVKYVNPENPDETWSGRGRRPAWVRAALEAGRSLEDLAA